MRYFYLYVCVCLFCSSCVTKEEYLDDYQNFMNQVKMNWKLYSEDEWVEKVEEFEKYNKYDYAKHKGELTPSEQIKIKRFDFAFHFYKGDISVNKLFKGEYNEVLKKYIAEFIKEVKKIITEVGIFIQDIRAEGLTNIVNQLIE